MATRLSKEQAQLIRNKHKAREAELWRLMHDANTDWSGVIARLLDEARESGAGSRELADALCDALSPEDGEYPDEGNLFIALWDLANRERA